MEARAKAKAASATAKPKAKPKAAAAKGKANTLENDKKVENVKLNCLGLMFDFFFAGGPACCQDFRRLR